MKEKLSWFIFGLGPNVGYARTKKDVLAIVSRVVEAKGMAKCPVTHGWWDSFRRRHPHLTNNWLQCEVCPG